MMIINSSDAWKNFGVTIDKNEQLKLSSQNPLVLENLLWVKDALTKACEARTAQMTYDKLKNRLKNQINVISDEWQAICLAAKYRKKTYQKAEKIFKITQIKVEFEIYQEPEINLNE